jgi:hypothetical protein
VSRLYGRDQQVRELLGTEATVTAISGDSGVGKTQVLEEVVALFDGVAPTPVVAGRAPAALQTGLLDALGAAAAVIADDEGGARRVGKLLVEGGRRLASAKAGEIGHAVARVVLGIIRDRVGKNLTDVIAEYVEQVRDAAQDDVLARIRQAGDPDVIFAIAGLAADVADAAGGRRILRPLENVDRLQPDDQARLMEFGPLLPGEVSVLCTFTSVSGFGESTLDDYILAGIRVYPLLGLEAWAVEQPGTAKDCTWLTLKADSRSSHSSRSFPRSRHAPYRLAAVHARAGRPGRKMNDNPVRGKRDEGFGLGKAEC